MIIEVLSLLIAVIYVIVALYLKKELKLINFIIVLISAVYILKSSVVMYSLIVEDKNTDFLIYVIIGAVAIIWVSIEKIFHLVKK